MTCSDTQSNLPHGGRLGRSESHPSRAVARPPPSPSLDNKQGRASDDAIRSLVISYKLLGTKEFVVVHHSECGMQLFTSEVRGPVAASVSSYSLLNL